MTLLLHRIINKKGDKMKHAALKMGNLTCKKALTPLDTLMTTCFLLGIMGTSYLTPLWLRSHLNLRTPSDLFLLSWLKPGTKES